VKATSWPLVGASTRTLCLDSAAPHPFRFSQPSPPCPGWPGRRRTRSPRRSVGEVLAGAGHDSNMFCRLRLTRPRLRRRSRAGSPCGTGTERSAGLAKMALGPGLQARLPWLGCGWLDVAARRRAFLGDARAEGLRSWLGVSVGRFDAYRFPEEGFWLAGGNLGLRFEITSVCACPPPIASTGAAPPMGPAAWRAQRGCTRPMAA